MRSVACAHWHCGTARTHTETGTHDECAECAKFVQHKVKYTRARQEYAADRDRPCEPGEVVVSVDLMKVTVIPQMPYPECVFTSREIVFTETFSPLGKGSRKADGFAAVWNESTAGRKTDNLASTFWQFLLSVRDATSVIIFVDNCGGHNKNWLLFSALIKMVNSDLIAAEKVCVKYLCKGHTFMSADADHSVIETALGRKGTVLDMTDFCDCVAVSRLQVKQLVCTDMRLWTDDISFSQLQKLGERRPMLTDVVVCEVRRLSSKIFFKLHHYNNDFIGYDILKRTTDIATLPDIVKVRRGISASKKNEIVQKLVPLMPTSRRAYWVDMPVSTTSRFV
jgi:hypothetical protein